MATIEKLKDVRAEVRKHEAKVERAIKAERANIADIRDLAEHEKAIIVSVRERRQALLTELRREVERDEHGKGLHGEPWERWAEARRDELADILDGAIGRLDFLMETRLERSLKDLDELRKRDADLDRRVERLTRKIKRKREDKDGQLTPNFHVAEFDCHNGTPVPPASYDALEAHCRNYLEPLRAAHGAVHINSGYRTAAYNAAIGGATLSVHVYDAPYQHDPFAVAVDHTAAGAAPSEVQAWHEAHTHPDGMGRYSSFTHVDNRNRIGWADSRWLGP